MDGSRRLRILAALELDDAPDRQAPRLCDVAAEITDMTGAGIMLMSGEIPNGSVCSSNATSLLIEDLQFELGEGPCVDAYQQDSVVIEVDLADPEVSRWPAFSTPAIAAGVCAVFGFPMQVGAVRLGALNLYRDRPGPLTDEQHADALVMAEIAAQAVLMMQAEASPGQVAPELDSGSFPSVVHQATGMIAAQLDRTVVHALVRLRAHAFVSGSPLALVARDVVERRLRFANDLDGSP